MTFTMTRLAACGALGLLAIGEASADPAAIERCRQEANAEARIACLEAELAGNGGNDTAGSEKPAAPEPRATPETPAASVPDVPATPVARDLPPVAPETMDQVEVPLSAAEDPSEEDEGANEDDAASLGAAQVMTPEQRAAELERASGLRVARYDTVPYRRLEIHLDNGQVWRQINGDTQEIRASLRKNQTVDIEESGLGGYKLRLNEMQRTLRVRRIK